MGTLSYTIPIAGSTSFATAAPEVDSAFGSILSWANGNVDGVNVDASLTGRRLVTEARAFIGPAVAGGNYFIAADGTLIASGASGTKAICWAQLDPANFAVVGKANTQFIVRLSVAAGIAPAITIQGQLNAMLFSGSGGQIAPTVSTFVANAAIASSPGAYEGSPATFPAAGAYAPVLNLSGSTAAGSATSLLWQLFVLNS